MRRLTPSTTPAASPVSMTSPTPYWSSTIMNIPDTKSLTSDCEPNPTATPTMLAPMPIAARFTAIVSRIITNEVAQIIAATMLRRIAPIVSARSARRTFGTGEVSSNAMPVACRMREMRCAASSRASRLTMRRITRREAHQDVGDEQDQDDPERLRQIVGDAGRARCCR